jgi:hypothetical protein
MKYGRLDKYLTKVVEYPIVEEQLQAKFPHFLFPLEENAEQNKILQGFEVPAGYTKILPNKPVAFIEPNLAYVEINPLLDFDDGLFKECWVTVLKNEITSTFEIIESIQMKRQNTLLKRNRILENTDNFVVIDRWENYTEEEKTIWKIFRQALRDIDYRVEDPANIVWPDAPIGFVI